MSDASLDLKEIQNNIQDAVKAIEPLFSKLSTVIDERDQLKQQVEEVQRKFEGLTNQLSNLQKNLNDQKVEYETQKQTNDNKIVSMKRDFDLLTMDKQKLSEQVKTQDDKISTLESQKEEILRSLREQTG